MIPNAETASNRGTIKAKLIRPSITGQEKLI